MSHVVVPCTLAHLRALAASLREADRAELLAAGGKPRHQLFALWRRTLEPWAMLVDGQVAAAGGDAAPMLSSDGELWLFTTPLIEQAPLAYAKEARRAIARVLEMRQRAFSATRCDYVRAQRFFQLLGFHVADPDAGGWCRLTIEV